MVSGNIVALAIGATLVAAQNTPFVPLASKRFTWPDIPYKVDTDDLIRGRQHGYNVCNSTTEGPDSLCQTAHFNGIDDFCFWAPPDPGRTVGDIEGIMVAWCTKPGHGTRLIPEGTLTGVQWMRTPDYVQVVGFMDQTKINILAGDDGGEMDPHGADRRGNPMGGIMFSDAWTGSPVQVVEWHNFMGANIFCLKACDPSKQFDDRYCEHILDRIGCKYNAPNAAKDGEFTECEGENQDFPGVYTDSAGVVRTYSQAHTGILTVPYEPKIPASSSCTTHTSSILYSALATVLPTNAPSSSSSGPSSSGLSTSRPTNSNSNTSGVPRPSSSSGNGGDSDGDNDEDDGAFQLTVSTLSLVGLALSVVFLA